MFCDIKIVTAAITAILLILNAVFLSVSRGFKNVVLLLKPGVK